MRRLFIALALCLLALSSTASAQQRNTNEVESLEQITPQNVSRLTQLSVVGTGVMTDYDWRPDHQVLAVGSGAGIWLLDAQFQLIAHFDDSTGYVYDVTWSPDGRYLAVASIAAAACRVRLWQVEKTATKVSLSREFGLCSQTVKWSGDGTLIAIWQQDRPIDATWPSVLQNLHIFDSVTGVEKSHLEYSPDNCGLLFQWSPNDHRLVIATCDKAFTWNADTGKELVVLHNSTFVAVTGWSDNGNSITAYCWPQGHANGLQDTCSFDAETGQLLQATDIHPQSDNPRPAFIDYLPIKFTDRIDHVRWNPSGNRLAVGTNQDHPSVQVWDNDEHGLPTRLTTTIALGAIDLNELRWTLNGDLMTFSSRVSPQEDATGKDTGLAAALLEVTCWNASTGQPVEDMYRYNNVVSYPPFTPPAPALDWSTNLQLKAYGHDGPIVQVNGNQLGKVDYGDVLRLRFSPDASRLAVVGGHSDMYRIYVYDTATGELITMIHGPDYYVENMAWNPDSSQLAVVSPWINGTGTEYTVRVYPIAPHQEYHPEIGDQDNILTIRSDDIWVYTWSYGDTIPPAIVWSPDGQMLAVSTSKSIDLYEIVSGKKIASIPAFEVTSLDWNPNEKLIATGSTDGTIRYWGVPSNS